MFLFRVHQCLDTNPLCSIRTRCKTYLQLDRCHLSPTGRTRYQHEIEVKDDLAMKIWIPETFSDLLLLTNTQQQVLDLIHQVKIISTGKYKSNKYLNYCVTVR